MILENMVQLQALYDTGEYGTIAGVICPPFFKLMEHSPSLMKASLSNPLPTFSNCMKFDITMVSSCLTTFRKKTNCILLVLCEEVALTLKTFREQVLLLLDAKNVSAS